MDNPIKTGDRAYSPREDFDVIATELASLLESGALHPDREERVRGICVHYPNKLYRVVLKSRTTGAPENGMRLEPSDFMLRLIAAVRANGDNDISVLEHELRSLVGVVTPG